MKLIASSFLLFISISLFAQSDDYCPCMDVPNYFTGSYLDSLPIDDLVAFPSVESSSEAAYPVLVSESFFADDEDMNTPVELFREQPINVSPSDLYKKVNRSPEETKMEKEEEVKEEEELEESDELAEEAEPKIKRTAIKQKKRKRRKKLKKRKKAPKYRGKCPSFIP